MQNDLATRLAEPRPLLCPGVFDALSALLAEQAGFEALYVSGASVAYTRLGRPDVGLVSLTEVVDAVAKMRERVGLPLVVDADTGFGNALNAQRAVRLLERAGADAIQLEDQAFPKRCGHLRDKRLVPVGEMLGKLRAALDVRDRALIVARTDAVAVDGLAAALDRAEAYAEAGADAVFVEAPESRADLEAVVARLGARVPLLANMVEGGRTPVSSAADLGSIGFRIVIFPGALVRVLARAGAEFLAVLKRDGNSEAFAARMFDFSGLQDVLGTESMLAAGESYE